MPAPGTRDSSRPAIGMREGEEVRQAAQPPGVLACDPIAHLAHDEVGLGVRRLEHPHLAEVAEAGGGFQGVLARLAVDAQPVEPLEHRGDDKQHHGEPRGPRVGLAEEREQEVEQHGAAGEPEGDVDRRRQRLVPLPDGAQRGVDHAGGVERRQRADDGQRCRNGENAAMLSKNTQPMPSTPAGT